MWSVFALIFLIILTIIYRRKKHSYWKNLGIPSPPAHFLFGTIGSYLRQEKSLPRNLDDVYKMYTKEKFVGIYEVYKPTLMIIDPELINRVLVQDSEYFLDRFVNRYKEVPELNNHVFLASGQKWKCYRSNLITAFSTNSLKLMYPKVQEHIKSVLSDIE